MWILQSRWLADCRHGNGRKPGVRLTDLAVGESWFVLTQDVPAGMRLAGMAVGESWFVLTRDVPAGVWLTGMVVGESRMHGRQL